MRKYFTLVFAILILSSCGVTLESVVQTEVSKKYDSPLIVIPFEYRTGYFANKLKSNFEEIFAMNNIKVEILLVEISKEELALNSSNGNEIRINNAITQDKKDIVIIFKPVKLQYYNGELQSASYQITGIDCDTKREVWKANFSSSGSFGPSTFAKLSAQKIFQKLRDDKVLN
jgi:hypothetical protein